MSVFLFLNLVVLAAAGSSLLWQAFTVDAGRGLLWWSTGPRCAG